MTLADYMKKYPDGALVKNRKSGVEVVQTAYWLHEQLEVCVDSQGKNRYGWELINAPKEVIEKTAPPAPKDVDSSAKSSDHNTKPEGQKEIKEAVKGMNLEQIEAYFEGEERQSVLAIKAQALKALDNV